MIASRDKTLATLGAFMVVFIWSGWIIISRLGVHSQLSPLDISLIRFGTATLCTIPLWWSYDWRKIHIGKSICIALATGFPYTLFSFYGLQSAKAAKAGVLINGLLPVFGAFWALVWLRAKLKPQQIAGICIVILANALMLYGSGFVISNTTQLLGVVFLVSASMVYSMYMAGVKAWSFTFKDVIVQVPLINTLFLLPVWLYLPSHMGEASYADISLQVIYQGLIVTLGAGILITNAIGKLGAVTTSLFIAFVPVVTALIAFFFMSEALNPLEWVSIVLCTAGIMVYTKA